MIEIDAKENRLLLTISGPKFYDLLAVIKSIPDRKWDNDARLWSVPLATYETIVSSLSTIDNSIYIRKNLQDIISAKKEQRIQMSFSSSLSEEPMDIPGWSIIPKPFQNTGIRYQSSTKRNLLGDCCGSGKTIQSAGAALKLKADGRVQSVLILCPKSVIDEWKKFVEKKTDFGITDIHKTRKYTSDTFFNITTYDTLASDLGFYKMKKRPPGVSDREWNRKVSKKKKEKTKRAKEVSKQIVKYDMVIVDEAHRCSHHKTKKYKALKKLSETVEYLFLLSATPLQNNLEELYNLFTLIDPRILGSRQMFAYEHLVMGGFQNKQIVGEKNLDVFRKKIAPYVLRRTRSEIAQHLPPRTESRRWIELTPEQRVIYQQVKDQVIRIEADKTKEIRIKKAEILALITYLRQACLSTALVDPNTAHSAKLELLKEVVENVYRDGNKMVIYCFFREMCDIIVKEFARYGVVYMNGDNSDDLEALKTQFNQPDKNIFVMTKVGGEGLNLEMANYYILVNPEFNPQVETQLSSRIDRLTQTKPIDIIHLMSKDTYEERIAEILDKKQDLFDNTVGQLGNSQERETELIASYL